MPRTAARRLGRRAGPTTLVWGGVIGSGLASPDTGWAQRIAIWLGGAGRRPGAPKLDYCFGFAGGGAGGFSLPLPFASFGSGGGGEGGPTAAATAGSIPESSVGLNVRRLARFDSVTLSSKISANDVSDRCTARRCVFESFQSTSGFGFPLAASGGSTRPGTPYAAASFVTTAWKSFPHASLLRCSSTFFQSLSWMKK